jgi:hypothetical protein
MVMALVCLAACDRPAVTTTFNTTVVINTGTLDRPFNNGTMQLPPQAPACPLPAEKP